MNKRTPRVRQGHGHQSSWPFGCLLRHVPLSFAVDILAARLRRRHLFRHRRGSRAGQVSNVQPEAPLPQSDDERHQPGRRAAQNGRGQPAGRPHATRLPQRLPTVQRTALHPRRHSAPVERRGHRLGPGARSARQQIVAEAPEPGHGSVRQSRPQRRSQRRVRRPVLPLVAGHLLVQVRIFRVRLGRVAHREVPSAARPGRPVARSSGARQDATVWPQVRRQEAQFPVRRADRVRRDALRPQVGHGELPARPGVVAPGDGRQEGQEAAGSGLFRLVGRGRIGQGEIVRWDRPAGGGAAHPLLRRLLTSSSSEHPTAGASHDRLDDKRPGDACLSTSTVRITHQPAASWALFAHRSTCTLIDIQVVEKRARELDGRGYRPNGSGLPPRPSVLRA